MEVGTLSFNGPEYETKESIRNSVDEKVNSTAIAILGKKAQPHGYSWIEHFVDIHLTEPEEKPSVGTQVELENGDIVDSTKLSRHAYYSS